MFNKLLILKLLFFLEKCGVYFAHAIPLSLQSGWMYTLIPQDLHSCFTLQ